MVLLATAATVIASQAVISGAFSVASQSVQMGLLPRMEIRQTSDKAQGRSMSLDQLDAVSGGHLSGAHLSKLQQSGGSVRHRRHRHDDDRHHPDRFCALSLALVALARHPADRHLPVRRPGLLRGQCLKIPQGGWFPLGIAAISFTVLTTWQHGRRLLFKEIAQQSVPFRWFWIAQATSIMHKAPPSSCAHR